MVNPDEIKLLELAVASAAAVMGRMPAIAGATPALGADGKFDAATQAANIFFIGLVHTYYSAYVAVAADTTDWPVPTQLSQEGRPSSPGASASGAATGTVTGSASVTAPPVAAAVLPTAIKAVMGGAILLAALFCFGGAARADCPCQRPAVTATVTTSPAPAVTTPAATVPRPEWQASCHRHHRGGCGGGCSAPGCQTSSFRVSFFFRWPRR
jgi:hypothetical protein